MSSWLRFEKPKSAGWPHLAWLGLSLLTILALCAALGQFSADIAHLRSEVIELRRELKDERRDNLAELQRIRIGLKPSSSNGVAPPEPLPQPREVKQ